MFPTHLRHLNIWSPGGAWPSLVRLRRCGLAKEVCHWRPALSLQRCLFVVYFLCFQFVVQDVNSQLLFQLPVPATIHHHHGPLSLWNFKPQRRLLFFKLLLGQRSKSHQYSRLDCQCDENRRQNLARLLGECWEYFCLLSLVISSVLARSLECSCFCEKFVPSHRPGIPTMFKCTGLCSGFLSLSSFSFYTVT